MLSVEEAEEDEGNKDVVDVDKDDSNRLEPEEAIALAMRLLEEKEEEEEEVDVIPARLGVLRNTRVCSKRVRDVAKKEDF